MPAIANTPPVAKWLAKPATGRITVISYAALAGKTVTIAGTTKTEGVNFTAATSNAVTAANIVAAFSALTTVSFVQDFNVIDITATLAGAAGNSETLQTNSTGALTLSAATLTGGQDTTTVQDSL